MLKNRISWRKKSALSALIAGAFAWQAPQLSAAIYYWDIDGAATATAAATGTWTAASAANWSTASTGDVATAAVTTTNDDDLTFAATGMTAGTITVSGTQAARSITFGNVNAAFTVSGGTAINLGGATGGGISNATTGSAQTISTGIILNSAATSLNFSNSSTGLLTIGAVTGSATTGTQNITVGSSAAGGITLSGIIGNGGAGGNVGLTINNTGAGVTTLSGANTFTGPVAITQGQATVSHITGLGSITATTNLTLGSAGALGTLNYTGSATSSTRPIVIGGAGGGRINSTTGLLTLTGTVSLASGPLTIGGTNNVTIGSGTAAVAQVLGTNALTKTDGGVLTLSTLTGIAPIQSAMPINVSAGTLTVQTSATGTTNNPLGTGALTITPGATVTFLSGGHVWNLGNAITIANTTATANISGTGNLNVGTTAANTIQFAAGANTPILRFSNPSTGSPFTTQAFSTITGTGNVELNGTSAGFIIVSGPQNQTGTIRNIGTSTNVATLSGAIGSGITAISQAGSSPFTVNSAVPLSPTLNTFTSTGSGLWTFSNANTFTGTQPLTFNANSTGGISISGTTLNHTGTVTNSGSTAAISGTTTISSALGGNVGNVIQNSATSPLVLSGANTTAYLGTFTATNGVLQFSNTGAIAGYTGTPNANVRISVANGGILGFAYPAVTGTDITGLVNNANGGGYSNVSFAATGASVGLDTTAGNASFTDVLANPTGSVLGLVKLGTNTLTLGTANTYTGRTWVQNGTLSVGSVGNVATPVASSLGMPANSTDGAISLGFFTNPGALTYTGAGETSDRNIALAGTTGGATITNSGTGTLTLGGVTSTGTGAKTLTVSGASNTTFGAAVAGGGVGSTSPLTLAKTGAGTLLLGAPGSTVNTNTVTTLTIAGGVVDIGSSGLTISNSGATVIDSTANATINATGGGVLTISSSAGANAGDIRPAAGTTLTINANISTPVTNTGFWTGQGGGLELNNSGTLVLTGNNTIAGVTSFTAAGTISVGNIAQNLGGTTGLLFSTAGSRFLYTGTGESTAVPLQVNVNSTVEQAGTSGTLNFTAFSTTTAAAKTLTLQGSTAGVGQISGVINQNSTTNTTAITKTGTGTWILSGANTYTGATTVNGGTLRLTTGTTNNSAVAVNNGATLSVLGNYTIGNAATAAAGGRLTVAAGGILDLQDGVINTLTLAQGATAGGAALTFSGGTLKFDIDATTGDQISITNTTTATATSAGTNFIVINGLAPITTPQSFTLINAPGTAGGLNNLNFALASNTINIGGTPYSLSLNGTSTTQVLTVSPFVASAPAIAYWNGTTNSSWAHQPGGAGTATNWVAAASGGPDTFSIPDSTTNILMSSNTVGVGGLTTTIDSVSAVNSLNFTGTGTSNIAGSIINAGSGTTLTINAATINGNAAGNGMTIAAGSGANLINVPIVLGANQTWTNSSTNSTTVSGVISGTGINLTKAGTGPMTFSGSASNTYTGLTTVVGSGGTAGGLTLAKTGGAIAIPGNLTVGNGTATQAHVLFGENEQISPTATVTLNGVNSGWGYLQLQGRTQTIGTIVETTAGYGVIETREASGTFGLSNVIFNVASGTQSYQGYFRDINTGLDATNSLKITKTGAGTLQWGAANSGTNSAGTSATARNYSGGTDIQNGTLQLTAPNTAGNSISIVGAGNVSLNGGALVAGTLDLNGLNAGITGLDGTTGAVLGQVVNNVNATTAILTIGNNNNSGSYAGLLLNNSNSGTGVLGITKIGTGTQTLSGANSYSGATTISGGVLRITNSSALGAVSGGTAQSGTSALELDGSLGAITVGAEALSINGGGISNGGALRNIAGNNTYGGAITLAAQSRINSDSGTLTLSNTAAVTSTNLTLVVGGAGNTTISGAVALGTGGVSKDGIGTLTLGGTNTYTGNTTVSAGTLNISGTLTGNNTATTIAYGGTAGNTVVNVSNDITAYIMTGANVAGSNAVYNQTAGTVTLSPPNSDLQYVGKTAGYGYFNLTGGNFNVLGRFDQNSTGGTASTAAYIGNGGTLTQNSTDWMILAYSGTAQMTVGPNGTLTRTGATNPLGIMLNTANAYGSLNIAGGTVNTATQPIRFGNGNVSNTTGFVNLAGGTLSIGTVGTINIGTGTGNNAYYNFAGGTLRATATLAAGFAPSTTGTTTVTNTVFGPINNFAATGDTSQNFVGGLTIDTQANAVTLPVASTLLGATGDGIAQSSLTLTGGTGYIGAPVVTFTGGTLVANGTPATGYALISGGAVTGIVITNPGEYTVAPTLTLTGGGGTGASVAVGTLVPNANTGGLTKLGSGTLTISSTNTFGGVVDIKAGLLTTTVLAAGGLPSGIGQSSSAATNLLLNSSTPTTLAASGGGILGYNGTVAGTTDRNFTLNNVSGGFDASGTLLGTFTITGTTMSVAPGLGNATLTLQGTGTGATGAGSIGTLLTDGTGTTVGVSKFGTGTWNVTNAANSYTGPTVISGGILSVPTITAAGAPSTLGQSSNAATNLVLKGGTLQYTGAGATLDRNYTFGDATTPAGGGFGTTGATGPLVITGNMTGANTTAGTQVLTLTSLSASGANRIDGIISDSSGTALTGVTKAGDGAWTLAGPNTYTGATTISAGTLQFAGSSSLNSATQIGIAAGATLQIRDDAAGTINHTTNNITASSSGTVTIDVGNNGGATTNSTVAFGALSSPNSNVAVVYNFTGANGYKQSFASMALPGTTGNNTTFNPTTTSVTIAGPVTSQMTGFGTGNFNTLFLGGTSSGNAINGVISDAVGASPTLNGLTRITKQDTSTWTLSGVSTYRGITTVNGGTLKLAAGSGLANTAITVNPTVTGPNPTFAVTPGSGIINLGDTAVTGLGASLTLNAGTASNPFASAFSMQDNAVGIVNLNQEAGFAGNALTLGGATAVGYVMPSLNFDIGGTSLTDIDVLNVTKQATVGSGGVVINFAALTSSTSLTPGDYTFLNAGAGSTLLGGALTLGTSTIAVGATTYSLSLTNSTATSGVLTVTALAGNAAAFWKGDLGGSWNSFTGGTDTNFATSLTGATDIGALPDFNSNVTFTTTAATNLSTTLDANFTINSLAFNGTGTSNTAGSTIASGAGTNTLTINAAAVNGNLAGNGISVGAGSGPNTISAPVALGASQSWTVASGTSLAVSGDVSGTGFVLTLPGNGTVTLSGNNSYSGGTNLNAGTLNINNATAIGTGPLSVINATIDNTTTGPITLTTNNTQTWANNGALTFTGTRSLNLGTGAVTFGDAAAANFTITNSAAPATSVLTIGGAITGGAGGTAGVKTLTVAGTGDIVLSSNITKGATATALDLTVTNTGNVTVSGNSTIRTLNANGGPTSVIDIGAGTLTLSNVGAQTINSTGGTINGTGSIVLSGSNADPGDNGVATGATLTINAKLTGNTRFEYYSASQFGTFVLNNVNNDFNDIVMNQTGTISVPSLGNAGSNGPAGKGAIILNSNAAVFRYTGTGETSNKSINLSGTTAGGTLDQSGASGNLELTTFGTPGAGIKTLTLQGSTAGTGQISGAIINNSTTNTTAVTKAGTGMWTLSGANLYTGATTVNGGILRLAGTMGATPITVNTGGTLQFATGTAVTSANSVTLAGTGTLDLFGNTVSIGTLTSTATNLITNSSSSTSPSTATSINTPSGVGVYVDALNTVNGQGAIAALITDGATRKTQITLANENGGAVFSNAANSFSGGLVLLNTAGGTRLSPGTITGTPYGTGPIIIGQTATDKAGIYFATANQTLTNPIIVNTALGTDRVGIRFDGTGMVLSGQITANLAPLTFSSNGTGAGTLTGKITGSQGLILDSATSGAAITITLNNGSANNDYAGDTVIGQNATAGRNRTLVLGAANQIPNGTGTGNVVINTNGTGVGLLNMGGFSETINGLSGAGTINGATAGTPTNTLTIGDNNATGLTFSGIIQNTVGTLALTKIGTGTQTLSGANTYSGITTVNGGTLTVSGSLRNSSSFNVNGSGSTLEFGATNVFVANHGTAVANTRVITVDGGTLLFNSLFDSRFGNVTLNNGATWTSNRGLAAFDALLANTDVGPATITVGGTGAATMNGTGGIHLQGVQNFSVADVTGSAASDLNVSMVLADPGSAGGAAGGINKTGAGTMTLTAVNTYTGTTTISGGTLLVNNATGSGTGTAQVVVNGGTLGGTGNIGGAVTVNAGTLSPGASIESLSSGALTMAAGTTFVYEAQDNTSAGADLMNVGALSLTNVTLDLTAANLGANTWAVGDKLTLISYTGTPITSGFAGYTDDMGYIFGSNTWTINYNDTVKGDNFATDATGTSFVTLTAAVIPEPSTLVFGGLALLGLAGAGLRRRRMGKK